MRVRCPSCAAVEDLDDSWQGRIHLCSACAQPMRLPAVPPLAASLSLEQPADEGEAASADETTEAKPRRRRKRRRRRRSVQPGVLRYYTGAIGVFGWIVIGLAGLWLASIVLALVSPERASWPLTFGTCLMVVGNVWIAFIAYQDSHVFGVLCFGTILFTYVYIFMNPYETWRPAALTVVGLLFTITGFLVPHLAAASPAT